MEKNVAFIIDRLRAMHGEPRVELAFTNPLELTVATVLSAQCTDERVNKVTSTLFTKYTSLRDYMNASLENLEEDIKPTGFYRNKAKALKAIASEIEERFDGHIPDDVDTFATIKGIGRKSANLIVGVAFGKPAIVVDTHMTRVAQRIGFTAHKDPEKIERDLNRVVPRERWTAFSLLVILHGRYICKAKSPACDRCLIREQCNYGGQGNV